MRSLRRLAANAVSVVAFLAVSSIALGAVQGPSGPSRRNTEPTIDQLPPVERLEPVQQLEWLKERGTVSAAAEIRPCPADAPVILDPEGALVMHSGLGIYSRLHPQWLIVGPDGICVFDPLKPSKPEPPPNVDRV